MANDTAAQPVIAIVGPTGSGKSDLAQEVALSLGGEVVSADSMQVYRHMNIGTAKLPPDKQAVRHHLIDVADPAEPYSAQLFQTQSRAVFAKLAAQGKPAILCGGTGLYVQAALEDMRFPKGDQAHNPVRERWTAFLEENGTDKLWEALRERDEESAQAIHPNNSRRVIRALEMHEEGVSYAEQSRSIRVLDEVVPSIRYGIAWDREVLYQRIGQRVDAMVSSGLVEEVQGLLDTGFRDAITASQAIGYKEVVAALDGCCTLDEAVEEIKAATRRYAKRQISWFKRDKSIRWLDAGSMTLSEMRDRIVSDYLCRSSNQQNPCPAKHQT